MTLKAITNTGSGSGGSGSSGPNIVSAGALGATHSETVAANTETWLIGTLTADHTLTLTMGAGSKLRLFGVQDATGGRTLTISDGTTSTSVTVAAAAAASFEIVCFSDGSTIYIDASAGQPGGGVGPVSNRVTPFPLGAMTAASTLSANTLRGSRIRMPYTGTLRNLYVPVGTTLNTAQVIGTIFDTGQTTSGVRTRVWLGTAATLGASNNYWQLLGDPQLAVTAGQEIDVAVICDSATPTFGRSSIPGSALSQLPSTFTVNAVRHRYSWQHSPGSFTVPTSLTDAAAPSDDTGTTMFLATIV